MGVCVCGCLSVRGCACVCMFRNATSSGRFNGGDEGTATHQTQGRQTKGRHAERTRRGTKELPLIKRKANATSAVEAERIADEKAAVEAKRIADEQAAIEAERIADEKAAVDAKRAADAATEVESQLMLFLASIYSSPEEFKALPVLQRAKMMSLFAEYQAVRDRTVKSDSSSSRNISGNSSGNSSSSNRNSSGNNSREESVESEIKDKRWNGFTTWAQFTATMLVQPADWHGRGLFTGPTLRRSIAEGQ